MPNMIAQGTLSHLHAHDPLSREQVPEDLEVEVEERQPAQ